MAVYQASKNSANICHLYVARFLFSTMEIVYSPKIKQVIIQTRLIGLKINENEMVSKQNVFRIFFLCELISKYVDHTEKFIINLIFY